jgi:serine/threonine protein kinase
MIGKTLKNHYRIYDQLGEGSAGTVYLARDSESGQMAVVKVLHDHLVNERFVARFEREIDLLQRIDNPHVISIYDWGIQEEQPDNGQVLSYIITEFVEGLTLADLIDKQGKLDEEDALAIARQIALGLADIHERGIIHRDIKPQNIMITPDGEAKIIDFGLAKGADHATLTGSGMFSGTLHYASPEQVVEAGKVDHRADIYSLGVVLYEMLTAKLPVTGKFASVMLRILQGDLDPITGVSPEIAALVNEMLACDAKVRIYSAEGVIQRIERIGQ